MIADLKPYPAMKNSGMTWLGEVPGSWIVIKLRHVLRRRVERNRPDLPLLSVVRDKGVILRDITDTDENHNYVPDDLTNYKVVHAGQFAMNKMKAWQGSYGVSPYDGIVSPAYFTFDVADVDTAFFHRAVRSFAYIPSFVRASDGVRIGQWDLAEARMREIAFAVPPPDEQAAIVRFLDHADRKIRRAIRAKQKLVKLLEEEKQAVIHRAVTRGLDPNVRLKPSGVQWLGDVPEHWDVKPLKFLVPQVTVGIVIQPARLYVPSGVPCLRSLNISNGYIDRRELVFISDASNKINLKSQIFAGDIVVVRTGRAGIAVVVTEEFNGANCIDLLVIRASTHILSDYLALYLNSWAARADVEYRAVGAIQAHYNTSTLANLVVPVPPLREQRAILDAVAACTDPMDKAARLARREIDLLREYRTRLIADVVTGKLDVREAATRLPDGALDADGTDEADADAVDEAAEPEVDADAEAETDSEVA